MAVIGVVLVLALTVLATLLAVRLGRARSSAWAMGFPCSVRVNGRPSTGQVADRRRRRWPRGRWRGAWTHDVLLLERGVLLRTITALPVRMPEETLRDAGPGEVHRLGPHPVVVLLRLDDDSLVEVAAAHSHRADLVGPFLAAAIPGLPRGPREQRHPRR